MYRESSLMLKKEHDKLAMSMTINKSQVPPSTISSVTTLGHYLRRNLHLTGTKLSCEQGGCGSCSVLMSSKESNQFVAVNSCLISIASCDGFRIKTVEGINDQVVPQRLAKFNGSQCGFCSPGMVMAMESLRINGKPFTKNDVEKLLDGNICRCTGYRPILDSFKSLVENNTETIPIKDIEDFKPCRLNCKKLHYSFDDGVQYMKPRSFKELLHDLENIQESKTYKVVSGGTGVGIYPKEDAYQIIVDINSVPEFKEHSIKNNELFLGSAMSIQTVIDVIKSTSFGFRDALIIHLEKVASHAIRNQGTIGGNLMLKFFHQDFPSDIFTLFEALKAEVTISGIGGKPNVILPLFDWIKKPPSFMHKRVIIQIIIGNLESNELFYSYRVANRFANAHAYINAAFRIKLSNEKRIQDVPKLIYGGVSKSFFSADQTSHFLNGKSIKDTATLQKAFDILEKEAIPDDNPELSTPAYRKLLTQAFLYKFVLWCQKDEIPSLLKSAAFPLERPDSSQGKQTYETDPSFYPVNQSVPKVEGKSQCSGDLKYTDDEMPGTGEYYGAFVVSDLANCKIDKVDPTNALAMPGVIEYVDHKDIPGKNDFCRNEEIFSSGSIHFAGQPIGMIVAESRSTALKAAGSVEITYKDLKKPILTIEDALKDSSKIFNLEELVIGEDEESEGPNVLQVVGQIKMGSQYHFHMETHSCIAHPRDDNRFEVILSTQSKNKVHQAISSAMNLPRHAIEIKVNRLGGGFGAKISRPNLLGAATTIAAHKCQRSVRVVLDLKTNMEMIGKRLPYLAKYKVVADKNSGKFLSVFMKIYCDAGAAFSEMTSGIAAYFAQNCYNSRRWRIIPSAVLTNTPVNAYCRAPGSTQGVAIIETVMDHLSHATGIDPLQIRRANFLTIGDPLLDKTYLKDSNPLDIMIGKMLESSNYTGRKKEIENFNKANKWVKKGISFNPTKYSYDYSPDARFDAYIAVYSTDGSVLVTVGGIEMGQGLNTKVIQVIAKELNIPVNKIKITTSSSLSSPENSTTGGSFGSESCAAAALNACRKLMERMKPVKDEMENPSDWEELVKRCFAKNIDLTVRHMGNPTNDKIKSYNIWSLAVSEVKVDILTGETCILRADLAQDTGTSLNPDIDVGQIEGGFIMSSGFFTSEEIKHHPVTGKIMTNSTWNYKPPLSKDIPQDLRTSFYNGKRHDLGVFGSKATGEPSVLLGCSILAAIRYAIQSFRSMTLDKHDWIVLNAPATPENIVTTSQMASQYFIL
ncbi:uncharacterized protein [Lepeophtheirus salmonis]|uniref:uncharacterized protein isoform X3 n=1 Tax=Lepeophtheirus salmonis TaxID=72036 RepID=UPI003AF3E5A4